MLVPEMLLVSPRWEVSQLIELTVVPLTWARRSTNLPRVAN